MMLKLFTCTACNAYKCFPLVRWATLEVLNRDALHLMSPLCSSTLLETLTVVAGARRQSSQYLQSGRTVLSTAHSNPWSAMGLGQRKSKGNKGGHKTKNKEYKKGHATKNRYIPTAYSMCNTYLPDAFVLCGARFHHTTLEA